MQNYLKQIMNNFNQTIFYFRVIFHKYWVCQHASKNKTKLKESTRDTLCKASLDILLKKNNKNTRKNDFYLKKDPPLCDVVQLNLSHNHPINSCDALKNLRVSEEVSMF